MALKQYKMRIRQGEEPPEDWSRFLIPFADGGLRLRQTFVRECIIEAGPLTLENLKQSLSQFVEIYEYDGTPTTREDVYTDQREDYKWWRTDG